MTTEDFQKLAPQEQSKRLRSAAHKEFCKAGQGMDINRMLKCLEQATTIEDKHGIDPFKVDCEDCKERSEATAQGNYTQHEKLSLTRMVKEALA